MGSFNKMGDQIIYTEKQIKRFWSYVNKTENCWLWTGPKHSAGYGQFLKPQRYAHRFVLELVAPIKKGMMVDHICRNRICVNPNHLRIVTPRINAIENSMCPSAINHNKTHCSKGHELTKENTYIKTTIRKNGNIKKTRKCTKCRYSSGLHYSTKKPDPELLVLLRKEKLTIKQISQATGFSCGAIIKNLRRSGIDTGQFVKLFCKRGHSLKETRGKDGCSVCIRIRKRNSYRKKNNLPKSKLRGAYKPEGAVWEIF